MKSVKQINLSKFKDDLIKKAFEDLAHSTKYNEDTIQSVKIFIQYENGEEAIYKHSLKRTRDETLPPPNKAVKASFDEQEEQEEELNEIHEQIDQVIEDDVSENEENDENESNE